MATDKTPDHKRIKRAEEGRDEWKMKAIARREENEKLKLELNEKETYLTSLREANKKIKKELYEATEKATKFEMEIKLLKKKASK
jgi:hypothetical protein